MTTGSMPGPLVGNWGWDEGENGQTLTLDPHDLHPDLSTPRPADRVQVSGPHGLSAGDFPSGGFLLPGRRERQRRVH